jgi:hypothetical protein
MFQSDVAVTVGDTTIEFSVGAIEVLSPEGNREYVSLPDLISYGEVHLMVLHMQSEGYKIVRYITNAVAARSGMDLTLSPKVGDFKDHAAYLKA